MKWLAAVKTQWLSSVQCSIRKLIKSVLILVPRLSTWRYTQLQLWRLQIWIDIWRRRPGCSKAAAVLWRRWQTWIKGGFCVQDRETDRRTPNLYIDPAPDSVNNWFVPSQVHATRRKYFHSVIRTLETRFSVSHERRFTINARNTKNSHYDINSKMTKYAL